MNKIINIIFIILALIFISNRLEILKKKFKFTVFFFFTNLSIIFSMVYYIFDLFNISNFYFKHYLMFYMLVVMFIYNVILAPQAKNSNTNHDFYSIYDCIAHIILPILMLLDYVFFTKHLIIPIWSIAVSLFYPILYCVLVLIKGIYKLGNTFKHSNNYYPYYFLEIDTYGIKRVIINIIALLLVFIFLELILLLINNYLFI